MKTEKPAGGAILTVMAAAGQADAVSEWVSGQLGRAVVEFKKPGGGDTALDIYFDSAVEAEIAARALEQFAVKGFAVRPYADEEWAESWKRHFKPMDIGRRLRVVPPWMAGGSDRTEVVINPGLSFGTGNHFTTRFCLEQLDLRVPELGAPTVLDIGTGSGVLAISAVRLGARSAVGTDFDPVCIECAQENARLNGAAERTEFRRHDINEGWPEERYDIVCANIYSSLLIDHAAVLLRLAGKYLLLTGIREVELDGVAEAFARLGGREIVRDSDCEWGGLVMAR